MRAWIRLVFLVWMAGLGGCASLPPSPAASAGVATVSDAWAMQGRVAVRAGDDAGSGRLSWRQTGRDFEIILSAPITRQGWRLSRRDGLAQLDGLGSGPLQGPDAEALLLQATGWPLPVDAMAAWLRGEPATAEARSARDPRGRLQWLEEAGWRVEYREWDGANPARPRKLFASREGAGVRLVVESWE